MITINDLRGENKSKRWVIWMAMGIAVVLGMATAAFGAGPTRTREPGRLSDEIRRIAKPMDSLPPSQNELKHAVPDVAARLWTILKYYHTGQPAKARAVWEQIALPQDTEIWREIALGALYLEAGDLRQAELFFQTARTSHPNHAVLAYYTGLLRLEQASSAVRGLDEKDRHMLLATTVTPDGFQSKQAYERMAMAEFRNAIGRAHEIHFDEPLIHMSDRYDEIMYIPTVGHLLIAMGSNRFVRTSHDRLFGLEVSHGMLTEAEQHLDEAVVAGLSPLPWYEELVQGYLDQNKTQDALRVTQKYLRNTFRLFR